MIRFTHVLGSEDPISQSLQSYGTGIGGQVFLPKPTTGNSFYDSDEKIPKGRVPTRLRKHG